MKINKYFFVIGLLGIALYSLIFIRNYSSYSLQRNTFVKEVIGSNKFQKVQNYRELYRDSQKIVYEIDAEKKMDIVFPEVYSQNWYTRVNGEAVPTKEIDSFTGVTLNKGKNYIEFTYLPVLLLSGLIICLVFLFIALLYLCRTLFFNKKILDYKKKIKKNSVVIRSASFPQHFFIVATGLGIGLCVFLFLIRIYPLQMQMPWTTAINWYTIHNYPKQQVYYYYYGGFIIIMTVAFIFWILSQWRIKSK